MRTSLIFILSLVLLITGCGHGNVRPDRVMPATDANYPTAEFSACGSSFHGLGVCFLERGSDLNRIELTIQGYYEGTIRVVSQTCELDEVLRYNGSQGVRIGIPTIARESCLISFIVSPEYPSEGDQAIVIRSFKGHLWVGVKESGDEAQGFASKVPEAGEASIRLSVPDDGDHRVVFRGCGVQYDQTLHSSGGVMDLRLRSLIPAIGVQRCILQGGIETRTGTIFVTWAVWGYKKEFVPLPVPAIKFDGDKIEIAADPNTSVIAVDDEWKLETKASFKFKRTDSHTVRLLTVGGRSVIGHWKSGRFTWMQ